MGIGIYLNYVKPDLNKEKEEVLEAMFFLEAKPK